MKNKQVLALNKAWMPVDIINAKDCFRLLAKAHAKALETKDETYMMYSLDAWIDMKAHEEYNTMNTVSLEIPVPEIIILTEYSQVPQRFVKFSKGNLLIRDDFQCAYCGCSLDIDSSTIDHVHPSSKGGETSWENCTSSCKKCNHTKGNELPVGKFKPTTKPKTPSHSSPAYQMAQKAKQFKMPASWKKFLFH